MPLFSENDKEITFYGLTASCIFSEGTGSADSDDVEFAWSCHVPACSVDSPPALACAHTQGACVMCSVESSGVYVSEQATLQGLWTHLTNERTNTWGTAGCLTRLLRGESQLGKPGKALNFNCI